MATKKSAPASKAKTKVSKSATAPEKIRLTRTAVDIVSNQVHATFKKQYSDKKKLAMKRLKLNATEKKHAEQLKDIQKYHKRITGHNYIAGYRNLSEMYTSAIKEALVKSVMEKAPAIPSYSEIQSEAHLINAEKVTGVAELVERLLKKFSK
jgi:hypothetical protein